VETKITIENLQNKEVYIEDFKTTFIILNVENTLLRFDFKNKREALLKKKESGKLKLYTEHPLLINHNQSNLDVFINSKPANPDVFIEEIKKNIETATGGWRNWEDYIEINTGIDIQTFIRNIKNGSGKLLNAPFSIVENIEQICEKHQVKLKSFGDKTVFHHKMIIINNQFVIAEKFRLY